MRRERDEEEEEERNSEEKEREEELAYESLRTKSDSLHLNVQE